MKKEQQERAIITNGKIDLHLVQKDILDLLVSVLTENIAQIMKEEEIKNTKLH